MSFQPSSPVGWQFYREKYFKNSYKIIWILNIKLLSLHKKPKQKEMETIEVVVIKKDTEVIDIVDGIMWDENQDFYPNDWDETEVVVVPLEDWDNGKINQLNYYEYVIS